MTDIVHALSQALGDHKVLHGSALEDRYCHIWKMDEPLSAKAVVLPSNTEEVATVLSICNKFDQEVVVHGGLTNLVGATSVQEHQLVLSLEKLNQIEEIDPQSRTATVQSGVIVEHLIDEVAKDGLLFPMNFGAKGSAQIGGIISTNAGGLRVLKYGMTRNLILGLEAVLANGTIISDLKKVVKDNSGYDLKQLFVGSEGTLGVVTKAIFKLEEAPKSRNSAWLGIQDFSNVVQALKRLDQELGSFLSGFELVWNRTFRAMTSGETRPTLPYDYAYYVLIESLGSHQENDRKRMEEVLAGLLEESIIEDASIAYTEADQEWFWRIREDVHVLKSQCLFDHHFDISLPIPSIGAYVDEVEKELDALPQVEKVFTFGHLADGNIHFIIGKTDQESSTTKKINDIVYSRIKNLKGSISAEHGIGLDKSAYLSISQTPENIALMHALKKYLDPKNILNPNRIISK